MTHENMMRSCLAVACVWIFAFAEDMCYESSCLQVRQAAGVKVVFNPGKLGIIIAPDTAEVLQVNDGQGKNNGVQVGMVASHIDGQPFSIQVLREKVTGAYRYEVSFTKVVDVKMVFSPGRLGLTFREGMGEVLHVEEGQARMKGVQKGMVATKIDGQQFSKQQLVKKAQGTENYTLTFAKDISQVVFTTAWDEVVPWMQSNGAMVRSARGATTQNGGSALRGVIADRAMTSGEIFMSVPQKLWLTFEKLFALSNVTNEAVEACTLEQELRDNLRGAVGLVSEIRKRDRSFYDPWLKNLPSLNDYKSFHPAFADVPLLVDFAGLGFTHEIRLLQLQTERVHTCFDQWRSNPNSGLPSYFTWDEVITAFWHLTTRAYLVSEDPSKKALIPGGDCMNTAQDLNTFWHTTSDHARAGGEPSFTIYIMGNVSEGAELYAKYCEDCDNFRLFVHWGLYMEDNRNSINGSCPRPDSVDWLRLYKHAKSVLDFNGAAHRKDWTAPRCRQEISQQPQGPMRCSFARLSWEICGSTWNSLMQDSPS